MAFCTQCGAQIAAGSRFCSQCGAPQDTSPATAVPVNPVPAAAPVPPVPVSAIPVPAVPFTVPGTGYAASYADNCVMLVSLGTCDAYTAADVLEETCGYTETDARLIVASTPITLARDLNDTQAAVLAQALCEYGMEVTVFDSTGYRHVTPVATGVYDASGSLLASAAAVLGLIGTANRLSRPMIRRHDLPYGMPVRMSVPRRPVPPRPMRRPGMMQPMGSAPLRGAMGRPAPRPEPPMRPVGPAPRPMGPGAPRPAGRPGSSPTDRLDGPGRGRR